MGEPPPPDRQQIGRDAEDAAARFLEALGLRVITRNYRCRAGELDIVAEAGDGTIVIAEVRLRSGRHYGGAAASVDWHKQRRIVRTTGHLLLRHPPLAHRPLRFDVLDMAPDEMRGYRINWIRHAFTAS